mgnify:CR=1 FL=1
MKHHVWVVEASFEVRGTFGPWHPCSGIGLTREDGQSVRRRWAERNPMDRFRVRKYVAADSRREA